MSELMVNVGIDRDEWYPVYSIVDARETYAIKATVPADLIDRARKAEIEFDAVQGLLHQIVKEQQR